MSLKESLDNLIKAAFKTTHRDQESNALQQIVQGNLLQHLMRLGVDENVSHLVRGEVHEQLNGLDGWLKNQKNFHSPTITVQQLIIISNTPPK